MSLSFEVGLNCIEEKVGDMLRGVCIDQRNLVNISLTWSKIPFNLH